MTDPGKQLVLRRIERATTLTVLDQIRKDLGADYTTPKIEAAIISRERELK